MHLLLQKGIRGGEMVWGVSEPEALAIHNLRRLSLR